MLNRVVCSPLSFEVDEISPDARQKIPQRRILHTRRGDTVMSRARVGAMLDRDCPPFSIVESSESPSVLLRCHPQGAPSSAQLCSALLSADQFHLAPFNNFQHVRSLFLVLYLCVYCRVVFD